MFKLMWKTCIVVFTVFVIIPIICFSVSMTGIISAINYLF